MPLSAEGWRPALLLALMPPSYCQNASSLLPRQRSAEARRSGRERSSRAREDAQDAAPCAAQTSAHEETRRKQPSKTEMDELCKRRASSEHLRVLYARVLCGRYAAHGARMARVQRAEICRGTPPSSERSAAPSAHCFVHTDAAFRFSVFPRFAFAIFAAFLRLRRLFFIIETPHLPFQLRHASQPVVASY